MHRQSKWRERQLPRFIRSNRHNYFITSMPFFTEPESCGQKIKATLRRFANQYYATSWASVREGNPSATLLTYRSAKLTEYDQKVPDIHNNDNMLLYLCPREILD